MVAVVHVEIMGIRGALDLYLWRLMVFSFHRTSCQDLGSRNTSVSSQTQNVSSQTKCPLSRSRLGVMCLVLA